MTYQHINPDDTALLTPGHELSAPQTDVPPPDPSVVPAQNPARTRVGLIGGLTAASVIAFKLVKGAGIAKLAFFGAALWSIALVRPLPFAIAVI